MKQKEVELPYNSMSPGNFYLKNGKLILLLISLTNINAALYHIKKTIIIHDKNNNIKNNKKTIKNHTFKQRKT